ncbi:MAG TPA: pyridoxamine 5'-phosphate oxidase family protein, partial [Candidatus Deferrimicrobium sp.]|nr:pyridoxamine 5'-phosphate oxidase family protein [Candidatus Deferrimicrobium sp.]
MINEKLMEVLTNPADGAIAIVTKGSSEPHVVNSWNSYVTVNTDGQLLIPVGGMKQTEENLGKNNWVKLTVANREVQGKMYKGTGFLIEGTANFVKDGSDFTMMKEKFPWARAVLAVTIESA